jgi:hypothetical protein
MQCVSRCKKKGSGKCHVLDDEGCSGGFRCHGGISQSKNTLTLHALVPSFEVKEEEGEYKHMGCKHHTSVVRSELNVAHLS